MDQRPSFDPPPTGRRVVADKPIVVVQDFASSSSSSNFFDQAQLLQMLPPHSTLHPNKRRLAVVYYDVDGDTSYENFADSRLDNDNNAFDAHQTAEFPPFSQFQSVFGSVPAFLNHQQNVLTAQSLQPEETHMKEVENKRQFADSEPHSEQPQVIFSNNCVGVECQQEVLRKAVPPLPSSGFGSKPDNELPGSSKAPVKATRRKRGPRFSAECCATLEKVFFRSKYLRRKVVKQLAKQLGLTACQISRWFYHRRFIFNGDLTRQRQRVLLKKAFSENKLPTPEVMTDIARQTQLTIEQVAVWFRHMRKAEGENEMKFTDEQLAILEEEFCFDEEPSKDMRAEIAECFNLDFHQLSRWWTERRIINGLVPLSIPRSSGNQRQRDPTALLSTKREPLEKQFSESQLSAMRQFAESRKRYPLKDIIELAESLDVSANKIRRWLWRNGRDIRCSSGKPKLPD